MSFENRTDAGRQLADRLESLRGEQPVVVGMARGGIPVAAEVARHLDAPLDVLVVRKVGAPQQPEYAIGAVADDVLRLDDRAIALLGIPRFVVNSLIDAETETLHRREALYRGGRATVDIRGRAVVLVDDGLATGMSARVAIEALRKRGPSRVIYAAPVCAPESASDLRAVADEVICVALPRAFRAVSLWYHDFSPTTDDEVIDILERMAPAGSQPGPTGP